MYARGSRPRTRAPSIRGDKACCAIFSNHNKRAVALRDRSTPWWLRIGARHPRISTCMFHLISYRVAFSFVGTYRAHDGMLFYFTLVTVGLRNIQGQIWASELSMPPPPGSRSLLPPFSVFHRDTTGQLCLETVLLFGTKTRQNGCLSRIRGDVYNSFIFW